MLTEASRLLDKVIVNQRLLHSVASAMQCASVPGVGTPSSLSSAAIASNRQMRVVRVSHHLPVAAHIAQHDIGELFTELRVQQLDPSGRSSRWSNSSDRHPGDCPRHRQRTQ